MHPCLCTKGDPSKIVKGSATDLETSLVAEADSGSHATFSYEEDAVIAATKHLDMGWTDAPILLHRGLLKVESSSSGKGGGEREHDSPGDNKDEGLGVSSGQPQRIPYEFQNKSTGLTELFMVSSAMLKLLPSGESLVLRFLV